MALNEDERHRSDELDWVLIKEVDGYEPPSEEALEEWRKEAPHPSEAVDYDAAEAETDGGSDS